MEHRIDCVADAVGSVQTGERLAVLGPRAGNHSCTLGVPCSTLVTGYRLRSGNSMMLVPRAARSETRRVAKPIDPGSTNWLVSL